MLYTVRIFSYFWAFYSLRLQKRQQNEISVNPILFVIQIDNPVRWIDTVTHVVERHWDIVHVSFWYHCSACCTLLILNSTGVYICSNIRSTFSSFLNPLKLLTWNESEIETFQVKWNTRLVETSPQIKKIMIYSNQIKSIPICVLYLIWFIRFGSFDWVGKDKTNFQSFSNE